MKADMFFLLFCIFTGIHSNPGKPTIPDDSNVRKLFQAVEGNSTAGYITEDRVHELFFQFDLNGDGHVSEQEFLKEWSILNLGREDHASFLFQQVDTDRDGQLSQNPDISRVYSFFDTNGDHRVSEDEFLTIWYSISGGDQ
ncbi:hypothetical protein ACJMK2_029152 [Sinanodonta woodiana]|uniref:EF-hand domain-containing protein n=1 Tax=Sinanodonta woodiana TaxID=1069815 RepID=A0ABD3XCY1_SINWO